MGLKKGLGLSRNRVMMLRGLSSFSSLQIIPTGTDDASVGTVTWNNPQNILSSNNARASCSLTPSVVTHYLKGNAWGFTIPAGSIITGIKVEIEKSQSTIADDTDATDNIVKLVKNGIVSGDNKALAGLWASTDTYYTYGGQADLWGLAWTTADINAANFGVVISAIATADIGSVSVRVDHMRITVYYDN